MLLRWFEAHRREALSAVIVALAVAILAAESVFEADERPSAAVVVVSLAAGAALFVRRRWPLVVLLLAVGARVSATWSSGSSLALLPITAVALYSVARAGERRPAIVTASVVALGMAAALAALGDDGFFVELLEEGAQALLPVAVADAVRTREDRLQDRIEREAEARVQAERLRIARDLHDVVAHGLSAIAVQSGVAARLLDRDPDQARDALEAINATGRASLDELRTMVGALRSDEIMETQPIPADPDDLADVIAPAVQAGVDLDLDIEGRFPADVSGAVVVSVHRILQEALMNVARHANGATASVRVDHRTDAVTVRVENGPAVAHLDSAPSTGVGIIGMQERAESVGGTLATHTTADGGFALLAELPYGRRSG